MQCEARDNARRVFEENEKLRLELDSKRKELELRVKELDKIEAQNEEEKKKLDDEKQNVIKFGFCLSYSIENPPFICCATTPSG